jgi:hypothetical protein
MIKTIALLVVLGVVLALAGLLIYAANRPKVLAVQRTALIQAPAEKIHPLINDLHRFNTWNPYEKKDPAIKGRYQGPDSGPGARYEFEGNKDVGKGSLQILAASAPSRVTMQLDMIEPMEGHNTIEFTLAPRGEATEVTWAMHGASPFIARLAGIFINMDHMIGRDFEAGLANLKNVAERP